MSNVQTIPAHFFIQWHATGRDQGAWRATDGSADRQFFDRWRLAGADTTYTFAFDSQQGSGHPYNVFATLSDRATQTVYGVRIEPNAPSDRTVLELSVEGDELLFTAGELAGTDPKMLVVQTKPPRPVELKWSTDDSGAYQWTYTDGTTRDPIVYDGTPIEVGPNSDGTVTLHVTDSSPGAANHTCAIFYLSGRQPNTGLVGLTEAVDESGAAELTFRPLEDAFSINLFSSLQTNKSTILTRG